MSLINKVLQDLDQRSAMSAPDTAPQSQQVRAVQAQRPSREWFWRMIAALIVVALAWVGWIAYQLQPRKVVTDLAFQAAEEAKQKKQSLITKAPDKPAALEQSKAAPEPAKPVPNVKPPAIPPEALKLALSIDTPITSRGGQDSSSPPISPAPKAVAVKPQAAPLLPMAPKQNAEPPLALIAPSTAAAKVEKRDQARSVSDKAETEYRRGASLLAQGRVSEAESAISAALFMDPGHEPARQSLIALYLENRRISEATRLLQDGLALNPGQVRFSTVLARIHTERGDYPSALDILSRSKTAAAGDAEFNSLLGAVLQRMSRHAEAAEAYRSAVNAVPQNGISWVGLGISLEAMARKPEAADAFRRAVSTGTLTADVKTYAEQRVRALR